MSDAQFRTFHALRIKGFAKASAVAEIADVPVSEAENHLAELQQRELAMFREARALWQLTPAGRQAHARELADDVAASGDVGQLRDPYSRFLEINDEFKTLCGDWQLRGGQVNDHRDLQYDRQVIERLVDLNRRAAPIVDALGDALQRLKPYGPRLEMACRRVLAGDTNMFTGVLCGSYHDVWMELHEDLILSQGISRSAEGSY